jgi:hypothetical protein
MIIACCLYIFCACVSVSVQSLWRQAGKFHRVHDLYSPEHSVNKLERFFQKEVAKFLSSLLSFNLVNLRNMLEGKTLVDEQC